MSFEWQHASPAEVDHQYSPSQHALRPFPEYEDEYRLLSNGHDLAQLLQPHRPLLIYIHGGYWQRLSAADSLFNATDAVSEGVSLYAVEYTLAPLASIEQIIEECITAVTAIIERLQPTAVVLSGCSAGAHLAAMCARDERIGSRLNGLVLLSGIYDLRPLAVTPTNDPLHLTTENALALSPQLLPPVAPVRNTLCAVGKAESTEFIRQNHDYAQYVRETGAAVDIGVIDDRDHFNLPYDLLRRGTVVGDWTLQHLGKEKT